MPQAAAEGTDVRLKGQLLAQGRALLTTVGNQSNLILDPDLDSYYVMSLTVLRFPELLQVLHDSNEFMQRWGKPAGGNKPGGPLAGAGGAAGRRHGERGV